MMYKQALHAYQRAQQSAMSPRYMEKTVFARAVCMLKQAQKNPDDYRAYAAALKFNQRLWTYLQSNLAGNDDYATNGIRTNLLNLSLYIDRQTISALAAPGPEKLASLIDIDIEISRGLEGDSEDSAAIPGDAMPGHGFLPN